MKKLPAHQYKIGRRTYGLTQADNDSFALIVNSAKMKTWSGILEYSSRFLLSKEVKELLEALSAREKEGKVVLKHRAN